MMRRALLTATLLALTAPQADAQTIPAGTVASPSPIIVTIQGALGGTAVPISASSLPLASGAATSALQTSGNTVLSTISGQLSTARGAQATANSMAVNIASDQTVAVSGKGSSNLATGQVSVGTTATLIAAARTGRQRVIINSTAATVLYLGGSGVTTTTGLYVAASAGASTALNTAAAVYGVVSTGTLTVSYEEEY